MSAETQLAIQHSYFSSSRISYPPNASTHESTGLNLRTETLVLILPLLYPIAASFAAWLFAAYAASLWMIRYNNQGQSRQRRSFSDRLHFALFPAIMMTTIQCGLMALKAQPQVGDVYDIKMTGKREDYETWPLWRLAAGCWFLSVGVGLTIVGVLGVVLDAARWRQEMKDGGRLGKRELPPLCP